MSLLAILIGCVTGFVSTIFGIGGSSIDTPLIRTFLGFPPLEALATPLPLTLLTATMALFAFRKHHLVDLRLASLTLATGVPGMILGSLLTQCSPVYSPTAAASFSCRPSSSSTACR
ncbi:MAG: TSUP family transporter [Actinobacteria bacterium]|nr:TSUP family transporter [Actinomycetota bacterium]MCL5883292.1 TSUP family transporter [Actinomycetota bacterium]